MGAVRGMMPLAGRYRLLSVVGKGGMGTVWRAHDDLLNRVVAVKEVALPGYLSDGERAVLRRRVFAEARATALLDHPGVVTVYDVVNEDDHVWIVMELIEGSSLKDILDAEGPLSPQRVTSIARSLLSVLEAAHSAGMLHRDVKPSNILITGAERVVLTDFGLALSIEHSPDDVRGLEGSPAYVSPEQARGDALTPASDLWSLGAVLYTAVEGRAPFHREGALPSLLAVLMDPYIPPQHAGPLRPVIDGLLRRNPRDRLTAEGTSRLLTAICNRQERHRHPRLVPALTVSALAALVAVAGAWTARWTDVGSSDTVLVTEAGASVGTVSYHDPLGYSVDLPLGWIRLGHPDGTYWHDPAGSRYIRIIRAAGDPLTGLQSAERATHLPGYHRLRLERSGDLVDSGAQWEYIWNGAVPMRALESRADGFDLLFAAPDSVWTRSTTTFDSVLRSFHPNSP